MTACTTKCSTGDIDMPSSTRLDDETEAVLQKAASLLGVTKSQIVRESIRNYCEKVIHENEKKRPGKFINPFIKKKTAADMACGFKMLRKY